MAQSSDKNQQPNYEALGLPTPPAQRRERGVDREASELTPERKEAVAAEAIQEALQTTESAIERQSERAAQIEQHEQQPVTPAQEQQPQQTGTVAAPIAAKDPEIVRIEAIMARGLEDEYARMTPKQQEHFREEGEKTAHIIHKLLQASRVKIKKIIKLLTKWLQLIPGVNKYFLEQEAKIKADELMELREDKDRT